MNDLTPRQMELLRFIRGFQIANGGVSPSLSECARGIGLHGKSAVFNLLCALQERGAVRTFRGKHRAIDVLCAPSIPSIDGAPLYAVPMIASGSTKFCGERL